MKNFVSSSDLVRGVHARASVEPASRAFSHARGYLRVPRVLLDEPRKKKDCS